MTVESEKENIKVRLMKQILMVGRQIPTIQSGKNILVSQTETGHFQARLILRLKVNKESPLGYFNPFTAKMSTVIEI